MLFSLITGIFVFQCALGDGIRPEPGALYEGGTVVHFPGADFIFTIPDNYTGFISPGEDVFVIEREGEEGYVLIITEEDMMPSDMEILLYQFIPYENDIFLIPAEIPQTEGSRYSLSYTAGSGEGAIKGRGLGILSHDGIGVMMFALGQSELMEQYEEMLNTIADSISFMPEK